MKKHTHEKNFPLQNDKFGDPANLLYVRNEHELSLQLCIQLRYLTIISWPAFLQGGILISSGLSWAVKTATKSEK